METNELIGRLREEAKRYQFHPLPVLLTEAADRLETLTETQHGGSAEHRDPLHHAHGGDDRVTEGTGGVVQRDGGKGRQALPREAGQTAPQDHIIIVCLEPEVADGDGNIAALAAADE